MIKTIILIAVTTSQEWKIIAVSNTTISDFWIETKFDRSQKWGRMSFKNSAREPAIFEKFREDRSSELIEDHCDSLKIRNHKDSNLNILYLQHVISFSNRKVAVVNKNIVRNTLFESFENDKEEAIQRLDERCSSSGNCYDLDWLVGGRSFKNVFVLYKDLIYKFYNEIFQWQSAKENNIIFSYFAMQTRSQAIEPFYLALLARRHIRLTIPVKNQFAFTQVFTYCKY